MAVPATCFRAVVSACLPGIVIGSFCDFSINAALANKTRFYVLSAQPLMAEGLTHAVFVATCEGSRLGMYHYVIEAEDEAGITDAQVESVSALGVEEYMLPDTVEPRTPIGVKLVFETWSAEDGEEYVRVRLVYQSTGQLRGITLLSLENPPVSFDIDLPGLERNANGYYRINGVLGCLGNAIDAYDALVEAYGSEDAKTDAAAKRRYSHLDTTRFS